MGRGSQEDPFLGSRRARLSSGWRGFATRGVDCRRALPDQIGEPGDRSEPANPVVQVVPELHAQLPAGLLQAGKRVAATTSFIAACTAADLALLDVFPDIRLGGIVVQ